MIQVMVPTPPGHELEPVKRMLIDRGPVALTADRLRLTPNSDWIPGVWSVYIEQGGVIVRYEVAGQDQEITTRISAIHFSADQRDSCCITMA